MNRPLTIMWVMHSGTIGGAQLTSTEALEGLRRRGHRVVVVVPHGGDLVEHLRSRGIESIFVVPHTRWLRHHSVPGRLLRLRRLRRTLLAAIALRRLARRASADVVVTSTVTFPAAALAARFSRLPHVWFIQEMVSEDFGAVFDWGERFSLRVVDRLSRFVVTQSPLIERKFRPLLSEGKLRRVTPGVEVPEEPVASLDHDDDTLHLVLVGSLQPAKGQAEAIRAVSLLAQRGVGARLELVGAGSEEDRGELEELADRLGCTGSIVFTGFTRTPWRHVQQADVALMCSRSEALGRVTIEAMKLGKPIVAADTGANPELIRDGVTGCLYRQGSPEDLAAKLEDLSRDRESMRRIGTAAREWARAEFSVERLSGDFEAILQDAVGSRTLSVGEAR